MLTVRYPLLRLDQRYIPFVGRDAGKGRLLAKPSGPLGTSLAWRTLFWAYVTIGHFSLREECGVCPRPGV